MAENQQYNVNVNKTYKGVHTDNNSSEQPKGCPRFVLNGVNEATDGQQYNISNEKGNAIATLIPEGFFILGDRYLKDNQTALILKNPLTGREQIGLLNKDNKYETIVDTNTLGLKISHQCDIRFRIRRGRERVIYWVNGISDPRSFNFDRLYDFYSQAYQVYLKGGGDPNTFVGERWDGSSFNLIKRYSQIPFFTDVDVIEVGTTIPGSYNFAIQLVDSDLNPTEWITTSNTVNIYNDSTDTAYSKIRGSRNTQNAIQSFEPANKSIRLTITNLDPSFPYYRVAIIPSTGLTGQPTEAFVSDIQSTSNNIFTYSGNNASLVKTSLEDILIENEIIFAPNHIEQIENRLILANSRGIDVNWCEFQKFASKISTNLTTKDVILNSVQSEPNLKNPKSTFVFRGYMPGDVYAFNIHYLLEGGIISPGFHVPGKSPDNSSSSMMVYELDNANYEDIHNCSTNNYWGEDAEGDSLVGHKVRHHRFPFRKDVGLPLFTRNGDTTVIPKYKLTFKVEMNVGQVWPTNGDGSDKVIPYQILYKVGSTGSSVIITRQLIKSDIGTSIVIYDEVDTLGDVSGTSGTMPIGGITQGVLNVVVGSLSDYMTGTPVFSLTGTYSSYDADSVYNTDQSKIFGIQFSNIEKPADNVIGFYITRCERKEDDKIIVDNAIFGPMIENNQYKAFGLLMPKQYYPAPVMGGANCTQVGTRNSGKTLTYFDRACWFFNPEYQFFTKKSNFNSVNIQGQYIETSVDLPTRSEQNGGCTSFRGVEIQDVQPGTSYNSEVNKGSDSDGFDMLVGYRNTNVGYQNISYAMPEQDRAFYLSAATYQNHEGDVLYNVSCDNKIGVLYLDDPLDTEKFYNTTTKRNSLLYGSLVRDNNFAYSNFMNRTYYKEHNNPFLFGSNNVINDISIFNGDAYISPITINSTVYYDTVVADRKKKNRVWQIVVGAVLVVAGIAAAIFTAGGSLTATAVGIGLLSAAAISYGVSLAMSGIKFEQFKNMIDTDYSKGLKDCVVDGAVYETIGDDISRADDTIRWFADRVNSLYIESSIPFALRDGITAGVVDFIDSPSQFEEDVYRSYLTEKLTTVDREQGSGRLYKGYATAEFYSMNQDYMRFNKEKVFIHLPVEYDCCADKNEDFSTRYRWSEQSFQEEKVDNYRVFLPNNYKDIEGEHGEITDLFRLGNSLFIHCREALWQSPQNIQERVTNEIVSFIGTGDFFGIPARKVVDDNLGGGGTQHKWASVKTPHGFAFVNEIESKVYLLGQSLKDISVEGLRNWFENNLKSYLSQQFFNNLGVPYPNDNNPANPAGVGYHAAYDTRHDRLIITKRDYLYLGSFSNIVPGFDPEETYDPGTIIITENGFEELESITFSDPVLVTMGDFVEDPVGSVVPALTVATSPEAPLVMAYGEVYMQNGSLIYKAKDFDEINYNGAESVKDTINVSIGSCVLSQIDVIIPDIPSKKCPNFFASGGQVAYQETKIVLGNRPGIVKFLLSTYNIPDSFKIYYGEPSANVLIWSTCDLDTSDPDDCMVSTEDIDDETKYQECPEDPLDDGDPYQVAIFFNYSPTDPNIQHVTLVTQAPQVGTRWSYNMGCPCQGGIPVNQDDISEWDYCQDCSS